MQDASQIPAIAEPWMLAFNASIELHPVMIPDDLAKAGPAIAKGSALNAAERPATAGRLPASPLAAGRKGKVRG